MIGHFIFVKKRRKKERSFHSSIGRLIRPSISAMNGWIGYPTATVVRSALQDFQIPFHNLTIRLVDVWVDISGWYKILANFDNLQFCFSNGQFWQPSSYQLYSILQSNSHINLKFNTSFFMGIYFTILSPSKKDCPIRKTIT